METPNAGNAMVIQMEEFPALGKEIADEESHRLGKEELVKLPIAVPNPQMHKLTSANPRLDREDPIDCRKTEDPAPVKVDKMQNKSTKPKWLQLGKQNQGMCNRETKQ
ncbi:hypothetical protein RND71_005738 [Anisodus tanguticus]|uniref:Uncharacterized protein n=1 Tax=Anisodus tanguticus TaxID=243964 RepID=A0AAE1SSS2_9SOLA|nr:hypothetical protein RND71_005738 [Anisodus tanguticus]